MLKIGDRLPASQLHEYVDVATEGCALGPNVVDTDQATAGRTIVVFGLPGAFTPRAPNATCPAMSPRHRNCGPPAFTKSGACRSTMPS